MWWWRQIRSTFLVPAHCELSREKWCNFHHGWQCFRLVNYLHMYIAIYIDPYVILQYSVGRKKEKLHREKEREREIRWGSFHYRCKATQSSAAISQRLVVELLFEQLREAPRTRWVICSSVWMHVFFEIVLSKRCALCCAVLRCAALCDMGCFVVEDDTRCSTGLLDFLVFLKQGYQQLIQISMAFSAKKTGHGMPLFGAQKIGWSDLPTFDRSIRRMA